jgi:pyridoxine 5-phosphate synthase
MADLGVNIDHIATLRQARGVSYPDPVFAASIAEMAGADQITCHLRCDRRHIQDRDLEVLMATVQTRLNVEMATDEEMLALAERLRPHQVTLVPERPNEVTTEGGLDMTLSGVLDEVRSAVARLKQAGVRCAIFADPDVVQVDATVAVGAGTIELNTAAYADAPDAQTRERELRRIERAARKAAKAGLFVAAGHGLHYHNVQALADLEVIEEYNIGHAIVARAVFSGLEDAVRDMKALLD